MKTLLISILLLGVQSSFASPTANYFRVWQGFQKRNLTNAQFLQILPPFMRDTVDLYSGYDALNNYIVVIPPPKKPAFIPDELALVGVESEEMYREIRQTPAGKSYSQRHWDIFDQTNSQSAKKVVDYSLELPTKLVNNAAYDMFGEPIDWSSGYTTAYIGLRKNGINSAQFLKKLNQHIQLAKTTFSSKGLLGYIVIANEKYEVAYMNWESKAAHDLASVQADSQLAFADANKFMKTLMYKEAVAHTAGNKIEADQAYSTMSLD